MSDERFGDRVSVSDISSAPIKGGLAHPQGGDPWGGAQSVDEPYGSNSEYLHAPLSEAMEKRNAKTAQPTKAAPQPQPQVAAPSKRLVPQVAAPTRKETSTLKKFREVFGLKRVDVTPVKLSRRDPSNPGAVIEFEFGLRGLSPEDHQWAVAKARENVIANDTVLLSWKIAALAISIASLEGTPVWEALGLEPGDPDHVRDPMNPHMGLRFQAAELMYDELSSTFYDTVENLFDLYLTKVDLPRLPDEASKEEDRPLPQSG